LGATRFKEQSVKKQPMNHWMISLALKPQDVYDVKKKTSQQYEKTKIPFFAVNFCSLNV
jgi:hypothetical protein